MKSEDVSDEELALLEAVPPPEPRRTTKGVKRDQDTWYFGGLLQEYGKCEDPECPDPRGKELVMTSVVNGKRMCRFSFLEGFGL